ncbi:Fic/DOC family protein [Flavonifractor plautii]|uniref:Fic/DOC family protein n=1 Tax=Eubacteriales TaxID=186802 RepID=UPI001D1DA0C5|nr:Fic family protein [Oscillibacter sp.]MBS6292285.1 Fic family protein [Oscillibacter sp.]
MVDPYFYEDIPVLRNTLDIRDEKTLDLIEAEQSRANMMLLYEQGFCDFTPEGLRSIHRFLFGDIYQWAGKYRIINIAKREKLLAGRSVWYSNDDAIADDLAAAFQDIQHQNWAAMPREEFVSTIVRCFTKIWQIHPFREGNTRTVVMLLTFFVEHYGYHIDQDLLAESAGYVRDAFVMASLDQFSEYEHLERILLDAVCADPVDYELALDAESEVQQSEKYQKYHREHYTPEPHYRRDN